VSANGRLPRSALAPIGEGFYLRRDAAAAWLAFADHVERKTGRRPRVRDAYRTLARQWYYWHLYQSGQGNLAAYPGTSNHGLGIAVDLRDPADRAAVDRYGAAFGFSKAHSDAPGEWWHIRWDGSWHGAAPFEPLHVGSRGRAVRDTQVYLIRGGYLAHGSASGTFGPHTRAAVIAFQHHVRLSADGVVGPKTFAALKRRYHHR
jgi:hypothetical protein